MCQSRKSSAFFLKKRKQSGNYKFWLSKKAFKAGHPSFIRKKYFTFLAQWRRFGVFIVDFEQLNAS